MKNMGCLRMQPVIFVLEEIVHHVFMINIGGFVVGLEQKGDQNDR